MTKFAVLMITALILISLTACGKESSARSVEAYCTTMAKHRDQYLTAMGNTDDLMGLLGAVGAVGDLKNMWIELAKVAPKEIQTDTESVRDSWIKLEDAAIKGDYRTLLGTALFNSASLDRVDQYMIDHCDPYSIQQHHPALARGHDQDDVMRAFRQDGLHSLAATREYRLPIRD